MKGTGWNVAEKRQYEAWMKEKQAIINTNPLLRESEQEQEAAIKRGLTDFVYFAKRYFGHLANSDFAYFHKEAADKIGASPDILAVLEWPREHAKSIIADVMIPMWLKSRGELTGMMIASANESKAATLLGDIQAELMFNKQYIQDFGEQYSLGNWQDGYFVTADGIGFWAFGRGQSPRGTRKSDKRPNYCVVDDIDDAVIVRNEARVKDTVDWILGDLYGAMPNKASRLIIAGNRIHRHSILAHMVGDLEPGDPKRSNIYHSKVYALENPRTREKDLSDKGRPAWKERYTREDILKKMSRQGSRIGLREFFHEHIVDGKIFKEEHLPWVESQSLQSYDSLITYNDPSYKGTVTSDYKAIVLIGRKGRFYDIIDCFVRQCSTGEMVRGHYNIAEQVPEKTNCRHYMEANFIQDLMLEEYWREGERRGTVLRIRGDHRKKPDKEARIENLSPFTEQAFIRFNKALKHSNDMQQLREQFTGFPDAAHDDGPDAVEGAIYLLNKRASGKDSRRGGSSGKSMHSGKSTNTRRRSSM
jgi:predicted phage terminase large subunit-like protein